MVGVGGWLLCGLFSEERWAIVLGGGVPEFSQFLKITMRLHVAQRKQFAQDEGKAPDTRLNLRVKHQQWEDWKHTVGW